MEFVAFFARALPPFVARSQHAHDSLILRALYNICSAFLHMALPSRVRDEFSVCYEFLFIVSVPQHHVVALSMVKMVYNAYSRRPNGAGYFFLI